MPEFLTTAVGFERDAKLGEPIGAITAIRPALGPGEEPYPSAKTARRKNQGLKTDDATGHGSAPHQPFNEDRI